MHNVNFTEFAALGFVLAPFCRTNRRYLSVQDRSSGLEGLAIRGAGKVMINGIACGMILHSDGRDIPLIADRW